MASYEQEPEKYALRLYARDEPERAEAELRSMLADVSWGLLPVAVTVILVVVALSVRV